MKRNKSFLLFGLLAWLFTACNTDDLEKDIDTLTARVTDMETQMRTLNDNLNIVRIMLDGNKTIMNYSQDGGTYTLTLSNGETFKLTPGTIGGNYPSVSISENGTWVVGGTDTGKRAVAINGTDATITPQFKIENKAWFVSYDGGKNWEQLVNGNPTEIDGITPNPVSEAKIEGDFFIIKMNDGKEHKIPVVKNLACTIAKDGLNLSDGVWLVAQESENTLKVNMGPNSQDASIRIITPVEWKAVRTTDKDGMAVFTVHSPAGANECTLVVELTKGVNTITDQLKVRTITDSNYADYLAGFDIMIGDVAINKYDYPEAILIEGVVTISEPGCYFIKDSETVKAAVSLNDGKMNNVILIADNKEERVNATAGNAFVSIVGEYFLCKGIHFTTTKTSGRWFDQSGATAPAKRVYWEDCSFDVPDMNFSFFNAGNAGIENILIKYCFISSKNSTNKNFIQLGGTATFTNITICNNVFYSKPGSISGLSLFGLDKTGATFADGGMVKIENNTLVNIGAKAALNFISVPMRPNWTMNNNLIWYDTEITNRTTLVGAGIEGQINFDSFGNNRVFTSLPQSDATWRIADPNTVTFPEGKNFRLDVTPNITAETIFVYENGITNYALTPEYAALGIGAIVK